jgi:hypothetical protein
MCPDMFRTLALECVQLARRTDNPERRSLLIDMAHSWADLANSAERFEQLVEKAAVKMSAIKAPGWRLPYSRHRPRSAVIVRSIKQGRTKRKVCCLTPRNRHDRPIALRQD